MNSINTGEAEPRFCVIESCKLQDSNSHENYIVKEILQHTNDISNVPAIRFCREHENVARQLYFDEYKTCHKKATIKTTGLHIYESKPFMAASPDGLVSCKCCGNGLIEIKCSYYHREDTPEEIARDPNYHLYVEDNSVHLTLHGTPRSKVNLVLLIASGVIFVLNKELLLYGTSVLRCFEI